MPELPEVETVVRDLRPCLVGRTIRKVETSRLALRGGGKPKTPLKRIVGQTIHSVTRRGKWIRIDVGGPWLLVHLGMTGQFTTTDATTPRKNHTHFVATLDDGRELRFRDVRRFGSISLFDDLAALDRFFEKIGLGPEPFHIDGESWRGGLKKTGRNLKACLLDQSFVAGVGNIYADESLFEAELSPRLPGRRLTAKQAERLRLAVVGVLTRAIEQRGSTIRDYVGGSGLMGGFQDEFRAYGRTGLPCVRCGTMIRRIVLAGRSTHFCPKCQRGKS